MRKLLYVVSLVIALVAFGSPMLVTASQAVHPNFFQAGFMNAVDPAICDCPVTTGNCVCNVKGEQ
jgi:hypothetical protein